MTDDTNSGNRSEWWRDAVFYQIYPRSFADASGDGVGDLKGITSRLDYIESLGVDALWLSPFYRSPMADFGYDVSDHCDVDPMFGSLEDFDELLHAAHSRGIRIIVDFVPNHVSSEHPWFRAALASPDDPHRDWFYWRKAKADGSVPNNWTAAFAPVPTWTLDDATGEYYLHLFLPEQPDLNWGNPQVVEAMHDVMRFWLDRGVDGLRADVVHAIGKDPELPDIPEEYVGLPSVIQDFGPGTYEQLRGLRRVIDAYPGERMIVGETAFLDTPRMVSYLGNGDQLNLAFNFNLTHGPWDAQFWRNEIELTYTLLDKVGGAATWTLSNHDVPRHASRLGTPARARAAAVLLLGLKGAPFLYMGEELGLENSEIPTESVVDPGGRDGCRTPMPWESSANHGWSGGSWLPFPANSSEVSVEAQSGDPSSMLEFYRRLIALRKATPALKDGAIEVLDAPEGVVRWRRTARADGSHQIVEIAVNFLDRSVDNAISLGRQIEGTHFDPSEAAEASQAGATLQADEARIVVPE